MKCDVLVAGGGSAGLAAAVAAARAGARTLIVDRQGMFGGMATTALVHSVCGLYRLRRESGAVLANPGFASEVAARLIASGGSAGPQRMGRVDVLPHHPPAFAHLADRLVAETPGLEARLHAEVIAARIGPEGASVELCCRGRRTEVEAEVVVDASGDASIAALAGAPTERAAGGSLQRPAYVAALEGVDAPPGGAESRLRLSHRIASGVRDGLLPAGALGASLRGTGRPGEVYLTIDLAGPPGDGYDPTDPVCLTDLEFEGRDLVARIAAFLRAGVDGFERSFVGALAARVGVRESRRAVGETRLETGDVETGARFPDAIALATWPIEMRETARGPRLRFPEDDRPCEVPLRALRVRGFDRLLVAGRCISASHEAQASIRVIGTCLATGEAAGLAAALIADGWESAAAVDRAGDEKTAVGAHRAAGPSPATDADRLGSADRVTGADRVADADRVAAPSLAADGAGAIVAVRIARAAALAAAVAAERGRRMIPPAGAAASRA